MQRFIAREKFTFSNDAIGFRPGGPFDCLGPYAKVLNAPLREQQSAGQHTPRDTLIHIFPSRHARVTRDAISRDTLLETGTAGASSTLTLASFPSSQK